MRRLAPEAILELESVGLSLSLMPEGKVYQRTFGGQCLRFGKDGQAHEAAAAAGRSGHTVQHTLHGTTLKFDCSLFVDYLAVVVILNLEWAVLLPAFAASCL